MPRCITEQAGSEHSYASLETRAISHSLNKHPSQARSRALGFRHGRRSFPWGSPAGVAGSRGRGPQRHSPECAGAAGSAGKDQASQADEAAHTGHGAGQGASTHPREVSCCQREGEPEAGRGRLGRACCATVCAHANGKCSYSRLHSSSKVDPRRQI